MARKERSPKPRSLTRHILFIFLFVSIPAVLLMGFFLFSSMGQAREKAEQDVDRELSMFCGILSNQMSASETILLDQSRNSEAFRALGDMLDPLEAYLDLQTSRTSLEHMLGTNPLLFGIVINSQNNALCTGLYNRMAGFSSTEQLEIRLAIEKEFSALAIAKTVNSYAWYLRTIRDKLYLVRTVRFQNAYLHALFDLEHLCLSAAKTYGMNGSLSVFGPDGFLLFRNNPKGIPVRQTPPADGNPGAYWEVGRISFFSSRSLAELTFVYETDEGGFPSNVSPLQAAMFLVAALLLLAIPFHLYYMSKAVFRPMNMLMDTMNRIGAGELSARPNADYRNLEMIRINDTFNHMIDQIVDLRIDNYEQQLERERSEMAMLKMQIRPHFILNCLKQVYAMAETGASQDIQSMTLMLSEHLRFILSTRKDTVPISEELDKCRNYARLSSVGQRGQVMLRTSVDPKLASMPVPPVSLLTLAENSIRHGRVSGRELDIDISVRMLASEEEKLVNITVSDNGSGFSAEEMSRLNREGCHEQEGSHVGLANVLRRMRLLYGKETAIAFENNRGGGARIELFLPYGANEEQTDETADCG